ncbi:MAG TPA: hypothetical protein DCY94_01605, partial [Firmicutes bacterium]|nr:hypothetical protein [Bacillota bacterium]
TFQKSADFYRKNFLRVQKEEELTSPSLLQVPFLDITSFVSKVKKTIKNDSHFAIIIDYQSKLSTFSEQAINNLIGGRINSDISVKVVSEPEDWHVYFDMGGNRIDATHDYETVDLDGSLKKYTEKQKRAFYAEDTEYAQELGGFAEDYAGINGDEAEFEAFNCCLADDYVSAMIDEDFRSLGEIDDTLLYTIAEWATKYDTDEERARRTEEITKGSIITYKDRTFADAVIENRNVSAAFALVLNGNTDPRLYTTIIFYEDLGDTFNSLLNKIHSSFAEPDVDRYCNFLESIFSQIGAHYDALEDSEQKIEFLNRIRPYIAGIRMPACYKDSVRLKSIAKMDSQNWQIRLKKM